MTHSHQPGDELPAVLPAQPARPNVWKRRARVLGGLAAAGLILIVIVWSACLRYVPPGKVLVVISKTGAALPPNKVLAEPGEKGVRREALGEGYHFVWPVLYSTELHDLTVIPPGKVGVVTALGGDAPADGRFLAEEDGEQGIRRRVLLPGAYRVNPYGYKVDLAERREIKPGYVGVQRRKLGKDGTGRFADEAGEKGILRDVLQPGIYYLNTMEYDVIPCEIGIYQTSYHVTQTRKDGRTALTFRARDGFQISLDCTIEWEVLPNDWPLLVADYGNLHNIERNVIDQQVEKIVRDRGFNYGAEDFLEGQKRESFQADLTGELKKACHEKNVMVRSAFIRNLSIPEEFLTQRRKLQLSVETKLTNKVREETAETEKMVEQEEKEKDRQLAKIDAETNAMVAEVETKVTNLKKRTEVEIEKMRAEYNAEIAKLEAERKYHLGKAEADVIKLKETAQSSIFRLKMDVFQNDGNAYLRYAMSEQLSPNLRLRVYHSGPGTLWTNMDGKNFNFMVPPGVGTKTAEK